MGASLVYLNEPNTEIEHEVGGNDYLKFAAGSMQGWRLNMVSNPPDKSSLRFNSYNVSTLIDRKSIKISL